MKQAFFLTSICTFWGNSIYPAFQSVVQSRLLLHLNEINALIWRKTLLLVSDRKAKRWWRNMGAKNVRGNVKPLACVSVWPGPSARIQADTSEPSYPVPRRAEGPVQPWKHVWHPSAKHGSVLRVFSNAFLISTVFTISRFSHRRDSAALALFRRK